MTVRLKPAELATAAPVKTDEGADVVPDGPTGVAVPEVRAVVTVVIVLLLGAVVGRTVVVVVLDGRYVVVGEVEVVLWLAELHETDVVEAEPDELVEVEAEIEVELAVLAEVVVEGSGVQFGRVKVPL
jgi:hypothetical protein